MDITIESYEEYKARLLQWYSSIIPKDTYIKEYKDGRELLYFGGTCQDVDLRKSYEEYCKSMEDVMKRVEKFKEEYEKNSDSTDRVHQREGVGVGSRLLAHRSRSK